MARWVSLVLLVAACERAPTSNESPAPPPSPPSPSPVVPTPTPPITPQPFYPATPGEEKLYDVITFRITETELSANGIRLLSLSSSTAADDIDRATFAAISPPQIDRTAHIMILVDKTVTHGHVVAIMEAAKRAGYTRLAIGTAP